MKKALSFARELNNYAKILRSILAQRKFLEKVDILLTFTMQLTPILTALIASYLFLQSNSLFSFLILLTIAVPSALLMWIRRKMKILNCCQSVWIELISMKENIFRLAIDGHLTGDVLEAIEERMVELRQVFLEAVELGSSIAGQEGS